MDSKAFEWLNVPAEEAALRLLGCELVRDINGSLLRVRIVETEAYDQTDEASHTFKGMNNRNHAMFKSAGHLYVYIIYGVHYCCNIVCGGEGEGSGVLIRAVEPLEGQQSMKQRRGVAGVSLTNGPGKLCRALDIDLRFSGHYLLRPPITLIEKPPLDKRDITVGPRIGISKAIHEIRRFYITNNPYVSQK